MSLPSVAAALETLGGVAIDPPVLQPLELYVQVGGEALRGRAFTVAGGRGEEYALRPDMTAPAVRVALGLPHWEAGAFWVTYDGPVFRREEDGAEAEFRQIGAERFSPGGPDPKEDARVLAAAIEAVRAAGLEPVVRMGDVALFAAAVESLDLPNGWGPRLARAFAAPGGPTALLAEAERAAAAVAPGPLEDAIARLPEDEAAAAVERLWAAQGLSAVGGRSAAEIAARLREKRAREEAVRPTKAQIEALRATLALCAPPAEAIKSLGKILGQVPKAAATLEARLESLAQHVRLPEIQFGPGFGRGLAFYDGLVFDLSAGGRRLGGGGRYDGLLLEIARREGSAAAGWDAAHWGAAGFGVRPDRLAAALEAAR